MAGRAVATEARARSEVATNLNMTMVFERGVSSRWVDKNRCLQLQNPPMFYTSVHNIIIIMFGRAS